MSRALHLLLVEDEIAHAKLVQRACRTAEPPILLTVVGTLSEAREWLAAHSCDLVVVDLVLPDGKGISLIPAEPQTAAYPLIVLTAQGSEQAAVEALKAGAYDYVVKTDVTLAEIARIARRAYMDWSARSELRAAKAKVEETQRLALEILEALPAPIALLDADGVVRSCNAAWSEMKGVNGLFGDGCGLGTVYPKVCRERGYADIAEQVGHVLSNVGLPMRMEYSLYHRTEVRWIEMRVKPISGNGEGRAIVMHLDVTAQRNEAASALSCAEALKKFQVLTTRQMQVLQRTVRGLSTKDTASQLNLSVKTVEMHRANIVERLGVNGTNEVIRLALTAFPEWRSG